MLTFYVTQRRSPLQEARKSAPKSFALRSSLMDKRDVTTEVTLLSLESRQAQEGMLPYGSCLGAIF